MENDKDQQSATQNKNLILKDLKTGIPSFDQFDHKISELRETKRKIQQIKGEQDQSWIRINLDPFKKSLDYRMDSWIMTFLNFFESQVTSFI